jgi:hypothetical protein
VFVFSNHSHTSVPANALQISTGSTFNCIT